MKRDDLMKEIREHSLLQERKRIAADRGYAYIAPLLIELKAKVTPSEFTEFVLSVKDHHGRPRTLAWAYTVMGAWKQIKKYEKLSSAVINGEVPWGKAERAAKLAYLKGRGKWTMEEIDSKALEMCRKRTWHDIVMDLTAVKAELGLYTPKDGIYFLPKIAPGVRRMLVDANKVIRSFQDAAGEAPDGPEPDAMSPTQMIERVSQFIIDLSERAGREEENGQGEAHEEGGEAG